jgi:hypothetical protein
MQRHDHTLCLRITHGGGLSMMRSNLARDEIESEASEST